MTSWDFRFYFFLSTLLHSTIGKKVRAVNFSGDRYLEKIKDLELQPQFLAPLENHTVTQGRDVFFTCVVNHLQSYKVAWIKSDSRAILAMHTHMVAPNPRLSVTHNGHNTWKLHVVNVQPDDSGTYMCQVNTEPMRSQIGHMKVLIPPDIMDVEDSSNRLTSIEGGFVRLRCRASGSPKPEITWRREDGRSIIIRSENERALVIRTYKNENLYLTGILRQEMGSYLCIASNGIPPTVSKRYYINVLFKPTIKIKNQIVFARINHNVTLECYIESSPKSFTVWYTENGQKIGFDEKYIISETAVDDYTFQINLTIRGVRPSDFNTYTCLTENPFGKTNAVIKLREQRIWRTTVLPFHFTSDKKSILNTLEKRITYNDHSLSNNLSEFHPGRLTPLLKYNGILVTKNKEDHCNIAKTSDTYYGPTDFPGSYYLNSGTSAISKKRIEKIFIIYIIIFVMILG